MEKNRKIVGQVEQKKYFNVNQSLSSNQVIALHVKTGDNTVDMSVSGNLDLPFDVVYTKLCMKDVSLEPKNPRFMLGGTIITDYTKTLRQLGLNTGNDGEMLQVFIPQQPHEEQGTE